MSIVPNPTALDWRKRLPVSVVDWIEQDLHRSFADLTKISIKADPIPSYPVNGWMRTLPHNLGSSLQYEVTFQDGSVFETGLPLVSILIEGYHDIISPDLWLDRYIRGRSTEEGYYNYGLPGNAYALVAHILKRGERDAFCLCFARKLVNDASVEDSALFMAAQMGCFATLYDVKQICTAAYQAYYEVREKQRNG